MFCFGSAAAKMLFILEYLMTDMQEPSHVWPHSLAGGVTVKICLVDGKIHRSGCSNMYDALTKNVLVGYVCGSQIVCLCVTMHFKEK